MASKSSPGKDLPGEAHENGTKGNEAAASSGADENLMDLVDNDDEPQNADGDMLNSGLFNIETSVAFKYLDSLKSKDQIQSSR
jgi:hypothetical protein